MATSFSTPGEAELRLRRSCADLERRLRAGEACRAEDYLAGWPELAGQEEMVLDLLYTEYTTRAGLARQAFAEELQKRFPRWREGLARQFQFDRWLSGLVPPAVGSPEDTPVLGAVPTPVGGDAGSSSQFEILGEIARGGMGVLYKARQVRLGRLVALKMIRAGREATEHERERFRVEAEAVARLAHPHIVSIYEVGEKEGCPYLALEYAAGGSLDHKLGGAPQPAEVSARLVEILARAIHHAHRHGIIHRDLKPANVVLMADGTPKVTDFGLAKRLDGAREQTRTGVVLGTPSYMAPEQAAGQREAVGPPTDVYALGAILYEMLTGRPPFRAQTPLDTLEMVRTREPIPPRQLHPKVPRDLETVCLKCLEKETGRRYGSAQALAEDLRRFQEGKPVLARPVGPAGRLSRWCRRKPAHAGLTAALALVTVLGFAGVIWQWQQARANYRQARTNLDEATRQGERARTNFRQAYEAVKAFTDLQQHPDFAGKTDLRVFRKDLLETGLQYYRALARQPENGLLEREQVEALFRMSYLAGSLGKDQEALAGYEKVRLFLERMARNEPDSQEIPWRFGVLHYRLGEQHHSSGRPDEALRCAQRACRYLEGVVGDRDVYYPGM